MLLKNKRNSVFISLVFLLLSCTSTKQNETLPDCFSDGTPVITSENAFSSRDTILITFCGDIMAHKPNTSISDYNEPFKDIKTLLSQSNLSIANLETPVYKDKPYSTYPFFNVHEEYVEAALNSGINVFSLANNHSNDQNLEGIKATKKYFDGLRTSSQNSERKIYSSGLKDSPESPFTYEIIECNGWKILFLAVTEILNQNSFSGYINYTKPNSRSRKIFMKSISTLRESNPCDLFILSIHTAEEEYVLSTLESQKKYYYELLDAGVDVVLANHPHVPKEWELVCQNGENKKLIFFAQGNTLSAQRWEPDFKNPANIRDYTGDGFITQVRFEKDETGVKIINVNPTLITTYITPQWHFVIKILNEEFIAELKNSGMKTWAKYLSERMNLMEKIKGKKICQ